MSSLINDGLTRNFVTAVMKIENIIDKKLNTSVIALIGQGKWGPLNFSSLQKNYPFQQYYL